MYRRGLAATPMEPDRYRTSAEGVRDGDFGVVHIDWSLAAAVAGPGQAGYPRATQACGEKGPGGR
jgi:hypothetical protein